MISTIERLKLYVLANIKNNSKLSDQVTMQLGGTSHPLSHSETLSAITKLFDDIKDLFKSKESEPLADKEIYAIEAAADDAQKQYDDVIGTYF